LWHPSVLNLKNAGIVDINLNPWPARKQGKTIWVPRDHGPFQHHYSPLFTGGSP
jgi:hypothetical protein